MSNRTRRKHRKALILRRQAMRRQTELDDREKKEKREQRFSSVISGTIILGMFVAMVALYIYMVLTKGPR